MEQRYVTGPKPVSSSTARAAPGRGRLNLLYDDQGLSSYDIDSKYEPCDRARYLNHELEGPSRLEYLENCRADLLWKLDELKDHLSRSCEVTEKPGGRMNTDMMVSPVRHGTYPGNHAAYIQEGSSSSHGVSKQSLAPDDIVYPYLSQAPGLVPYAHTYKSNLRDFNLHRGYTYQQEMTQSQHYHERCNGYCGNVNHDPFVFNREFHKPTCSCVHCFDKNWDLPVDPSYLYNQRSQHVLSSPNYLHHPLPSGHRPQGFRSGGFNLHTSCSQPSITPNSTEMDFGNYGISQNSARKVEEADRNLHMFHPIAGGAPFIACSSCFELLKLPRKHISRAKRLHKLKCGACSSVILFELENKALTSPVSGNVGHLVTKLDDSSNVAVDDNVGCQQGGSNSAELDACLDSNTDSLPKISPAQNKSNSSEFEKQLGPLAVVSASEDLQTPNTSSSEKHVSSSAELNTAEVESIAHPILSTDECPDHCSANTVVDHCHTENKGTRSELNNAINWQNSVRDSAVSTEIDMSLREFPNSFTSLDSAGKANERDLRDDKGAESLSTSHVKNNSADLLKLAENVEVGTSEVFVNWHLIPEQLVQKAELLAGPIQPGDYWYDIRAGFWGVMGYPCLGIIMPNIEEFNYPMPVNCAAGNTGVFVNGRELHQKDLDLLASRGLPETRQRSYLIEMSGEVIDEDTGEELDSIGRLAPTVERAKHGFGMKIPRFIARLQG